jgi:RhtB (resistance to homoserine/threonine) family protein
LENLTLIATVSIAHLIALISPGPDFLVACRNAIQYSRKIGLWTAVGFGIGVCFHLTYIFFGLTWVVSQSDFLLMLMRYLGTAYLIYLGISSFFSKNTKIALKTEENQHKIKWYAAIRMGLLTNLLNPKASLFFLSLFSVVVGPKADPSVMALMAFIIVSTTILWFSLAAVFLTHPKVRYLFLDKQKQLNRIFGLILIVVGIRIGLF